MVLKKKTHSNGTGLYIVNKQQELPAPHKCVVVVIIVVNQLFHNPNTKLRKFSYVVTQPHKKSRNI